VFLVGDFNEWKVGVDPFRSRQNSSMWICDKALPKGTYRYMFSVDGRLIRDYNNSHIQQRKSVLKVPKGT